MRTAFFALLSLGFFACPGWLPAVHAMDDPVSGRLTGSALAAAFVGKIYRGVYQDGINWREAYLVDGEVDYEDDFRAARGEWFVREDLLCTFYDIGLEGGCFIVIRRSQNCLDFYAVDPSDDQPVAGWDAVHAGFGWTAQGGRSDQIKTCPEGLMS